MASSVATCQAIWLPGLLTVILGRAVKTHLLKVDNKAAIDLIKNPVHHERSKHIRIHYHFVHECAAVGRIEVQFIGTSDQLTDILTKLLAHIRFQEMKPRIGVAKVK
jgi:hypothetical protein